MRLDTKNGMMMKKGLLILGLLALGYGVKAQSAILIKEYPIKISCKVNETDKLTSPEAETACPEGGLTWSHVDKKFSGGKHGVLERYWIVEDACGNRQKTVQYITLTD